MNVREYFQALETIKRLPSVRRNASPQGVDSAAEVCVMGYRTRISLMPLTSGATTSIGETFIKTGNELSGVVLPTVGIHCVPICRVSIRDVVV